MRCGCGSLQVRRRVTVIGVLALDASNRPHGIDARPEVGGFVGGAIPCYRGAAAQAGNLLCEISVDCEAALGREVRRFRFRTGRQPAMLGRVRPCNRFER